MTAASPASAPRPAPLPEARVRLARTDLMVSPVCLGTMTFGEQVDEAGAYAILDRAVERGVNVIDTAEMYAVPARRETCGATETILGRWFDARPGMRHRIVLATKVAGPSRNMDWIRDGAVDLKPEHIRQACDASLRRLRTDVIDLYQIHWPNRNAPIFGGLYFDPSKDRPQTSILEQLQALGDLVKAGKVRAIGLSNETPWGLCEFVHQAERHGLPRVATVQNPYALNSRALDNGLDEAMHRLDVSLLAYSPLGFGALTGKYDDTGIDPSSPTGPTAGSDAAAGRLARFESMRKQRWSRPEALDAARRYNALARTHGLSPARLALAFCYRNWRVASTIIGATSVAQLDENLDAWDTVLSPELLEAIDAVRWQLRDPAQ
jgi:aryl-alcohol dehydrogenase-like predicted oxidoreductase